MAFLSNAHTHTGYCDGKNTPEEMIGAAQRLGFVSLGFSGHGDQGFDPLYSMGEGRQEAYLKELRALQAAQLEKGEGPRLWVGLEQDGFTPSESKQKNREQFDYLLGSTHYLCQDFHGQSVAVDGDLQCLKAYVEARFAGDMLAMARAYFDAHVEMLRGDRPHIIGHFDLVRKHAERSGLFDAQSPAYRKMALAALQSAFVSGGVLEVNTGGMARGYLRDVYPSRELLGAWREMGGRVTLTSDCHDARHLDFGFPQTLARLKSLGFASLLRLGTGDALWEEVEC